MGLASAPATESIMGAVRVDQAGVGSAVNDSTRLLGGTLGVAVIGSIYASLYTSRLTTTLPAALPHKLAATSAFDHGLSVGCVVAGAVAAVGALLAVAFLPAQPPQHAEPENPASDQASENLAMR
jgi:hypothetical protein